MQNSIGDVLAGRRVESVKGGVQLDIMLTGPDTVGPGIQGAAAPGSSAPGPGAPGASGARGPVTVRVENAFRFAGPAEVEHFYPDLTFEPSESLLGLVGRSVQLARTTMAGGLELAFDDGHTLSVPPDAIRAPWSVFTPHGPVCTALQGGEVVWPVG
ncbi:DUF6188 family protein [Kitasatospora sp. NPDC050543]|uniref:DUF6188 family protein n=1 Tax=Kitasatospora sp. NPDC050543 TaxID=3364054 RepID=UPI0037AC209C